VASTLLFISTIGLLIGLRTLLLPFICGVFVAYLFKPLVSKFQTGHWTKYLKLGIFFVVTSAGVWGLTAAISIALPTDQEAVLLKVRLQHRFNERYKSWMGLSQDGKGNVLYESMGAEMDSLKQQVNHYLHLSEKEDQLFIGSERNELYLRYHAENVRELEDGESKIKSTEEIESRNVAGEIKPNKKGGLLGKLMKTASSWIIFPLVFIFFLLDRGEILHFFMRLVPNRYFELAYSVLENVDDALGKYIRGTLIECLLVGISLAVGFYLCGYQLQIAILIGTIGGLTNAIPFLGTAIACVLSAGYSLIAENIEPLVPFVNIDNLMLVSIGVVILVHFLDNAVFQPLVVGKAVNLHPLVVILGVFGGSMMFGFAGLIFAIPSIVILTVVVKTLFTGLERYKII
jgi:predicted PurR-regulated permease PerM